MDASQLLEHIIRRTLEGLGLASRTHERLLLGTACQESACGRYIVQLGGGPGLGIYQMENATHNDLWTNWLVYRPELAGKVGLLSLSNGADAREMVGNFYYATAMARIHYLRVKEKIPDTLPGQAQYWKTYYNTIKGKGTVEQYLNAWNTHTNGLTWV